MSDEPYPTPGKPYATESWYSDEFRKRWKIVRTDTMTDMPGRIISANEVTGECSLDIGGETRTLNFGPRGFKIVPRR
jgi:hypothetical protein